jgi:hypothetical protein
MAKSQTTSREAAEMASAEDAKFILGNIDDTKLLYIMALRPSVAEIEQAFGWLSGDSDIFGAGQPLKGVAGEIVTILNADEDEESARGG